MTAVIGSTPETSTSPSCSTQPRMLLSSGTSRSAACSETAMRARLATFLTVLISTDMALADSPADLRMEAPRHAKGTGYFPVRPYHRDHRTVQGRTARRGSAHRDGRRDEDHRPCVVRCPVDLRQPGTHDNARQVQPRQGGA